MLTILRESSVNAIGLKASDRLTREDYSQLAPHLELLVARHGTFRVLLVLEDFLGWEPLAAWDDMVLGDRYAGCLERCAIVGEEEWQKWMQVLSLSFLNASYTPGQARYFPRPLVQQAWQWVQEGIPAPDGSRRRGGQAASGRSRTSRKYSPIDGAGMCWDWMELKA